jgi:hypothetical protein
LICNRKHICFVIFPRALNHFRRHRAKARNHQHQDAIHAAGWVSLFTLHAIWPFLWIWATIYRPERFWAKVFKTDGFSRYEPAREPADAKPDAEAQKETQKEA